MGKIGGFKEFKRQNETNLAVKSRIQNYKEFTVPLPEKALKNKDRAAWIVGFHFATVDAHWAT